MAVAALVIGMTLVLAGCGQKGPLYRSDDADSAAPAATESAADETNTAEHE